MSPELRPGGERLCGHHLRGLDQPAHEQTHWKGQTAGISTRTDALAQGGIRTRIDALEQGDGRYQNTYRRTGKGRRQASGHVQTHWNGEASAHVQTHWNREASAHVQTHWHRGASAHVQTHWNGETAGISTRTDALERGDGRHQHTYIRTGNGGQQA